MFLSMKIYNVFIISKPCQLTEVSVRFSRIIFCTWLICTADKPGSTVKFTKLFLFVVFRS